MAENNKMFVNFTGSKSDFKAKGYETTYANKIVFISGALSSVSNYKDLSAEDKVPCIFTRGRYHDVKQYMDLIPYVKGVKVGNTDYNVANGGGYLALAANDPATLNINTTNTGVVIGLTDAAKNAINGAVQSVLPAKDAIVTAEKNGTAVTLSVNTAADLSNLNKNTENISVPTAKATKDYTDAAKAALLGNSTTDTKTSKTIEGVIKLIDDKTSGIASEGVVNELSRRVKTIEDTYATDSDLSNAISGLNGTPKGEGEFVDVTVTQAAGVITKVEVVETNIAKASDLGEISDLATTANTVVDAINEVKTGAAITIDKSEDGLTYVVKQGELEIKTINIPKDMVVESGKYEDGNLILTIANGGGDVTIPVSDLIDTYKGSTNSEIAVTVTGDVISATLVNGGVTTAKIANDAITTAKIADDNVTTAKIADKAVTTDKIDLGSVGADQLSDEVTTVLGRVGNKAVSAQISDAVNALDSNATSTDGTNIAVKVTQTDGKITAVNITKDDTLKEVEGSTYVSASSKASAKQTISVKTIELSKVANVGDGLVDAKDAVEFMRDAVSGALDAAYAYTDGAFTWEELS